jgi:hypothetical protein
MATDDAAAQPALDLLSEQVQRAVWRAVRNRPSFVEDLNRWSAAVAQQDETAAAILGELTAPERAALNATLWLGELSAEFDGSEATIAAIHVALALTGETAFRAQEWAEVAKVAAGLAENSIAALRARTQPAVDQNLLRLAAGYEILMKVVPEYERQISRSRGRRKRGKRKVIRTSIERLAVHCGFSFPNVVAAIRRLIVLRDPLAARTDDDDALLDLAYSRPNPVVLFAEVDEAENVVVYDRDQRISLARIRNIVSAAKKSAE